MPRANFCGLSKSKDGTWKVHYQHHNPTLRLGIKSMPKKYFTIKQKDNGELSIKYYNKVLLIGFEMFEYSKVLPEICSDYTGTNEIDADQFINDNQERLFALKEGSIYGYCIEHNKEMKDYDIIQIDSRLIYCEPSNTGDIKPILNKYCDIVGCTFDDLYWAMQNYMQNIMEMHSYGENNRTARERSIIHHYPKEL